MTHWDQPKYLLAILVTSLFLAGCTNASWRAVEPHYTPDSAPARYDFQSLTRPLLSVYGTGDGKTLWAVGDGGTILHSTDGATWKPQASGTTNALFSVYGTGDGKTLWAVGEGGTILHSTDGATWKPQASGTTDFLRSVYGTGDGKTLWAVGEGGTILHSTDGATWEPQASGTTNTLYSVYGTGDGKTLWAVGDPGTNRLWAVGDPGTNRRLSGSTSLTSTILHSRDGATWKPHASGTMHGLRSVYGTGDGKTLWAVGGGGTSIEATEAGRYPFINQVRMQQAFPEPPKLQLQLVCDGTYSAKASLEVSARNKFKFSRGRQGYPIPYNGLWHPQGCSFDSVPFNSDDLEVGSGDEVYFDITLETEDAVQRYTRPTNPGAGSRNMKGRSAGQHWS